MTIAVVATVRSMFATAWPVSTEVRAIGMVRNRAITPRSMSDHTLNAVAGPRLRRP